MKPFDRTYTVDMAAFGAGKYQFRAGNCAQVIEIEDFLDRLPEFDSARQVVPQALEILQPRLVSAPYPLEQHEPAALVQLIVAMNSMQTLSYGQKKSSSSPSASTTANSAATAAEPADSPSPCSSNAQPAGKKAAPTATSSDSGPSSAAPAENSTAPTSASSKSPTTGAGESSP